jgi:hypothetical protein
MALYAACRRWEDLKRRLRYEPGRRAALLRAMHIVCREPGVAHPEPSRVTGCVAACRSSADIGPSDTLKAPASASGSRLVVLA